MNSVDTSEFDDLMEEHVWTNEYDETKDWRQTPETEVDPDELVQKENPFHDEAGRFATHDTATLQLYHGTSAEAIESIKKNGLVAKGGRGADAWAAKMGWRTLVEASIGDRAASVFFTPKKEVAQVYANYASNVTQTLPVLLEIKIPTEEALKMGIKRDEDDPEAFRVNGKIKPEWIVGATTFGHGRRFAVAEAVRRKEEVLTMYAVFMTTEKLVKKENPYHDEEGKFTSKDKAASTLDEMKGKMEALKMDKGSFGNYASDTAIELTSPYRYTSARARIFDELEAGSDGKSALRAMDSQKDWGLGWAAAGDEWQAAQALGGNGEMGNLTKEVLKERWYGSEDLKFKPLSEKDVAAFKVRQKLVQDDVRKEYPSGEITLYRGISGRQASKVGTLGNSIDLPVYTLSSWSVSSFVAAEFAKGKSGIVLETKVKVEDVWSTGEHAKEGSILRVVDQGGEIVVLAKGKTMKVTKTAVEGRARRPKKSLGVMNTPWI